MSSVVKYNRIIIHEEKPVLLGDRVKGKPRDNSITMAAEPPMEDGLIRKAKKEAKEIIRKAQDKAQRIEEEALKNSEEIGRIAREEGLNKGYDDGYREGHELGLKEGQALGRQEYDSLIAEAEGIKQKYLEDYKEIYKASEENMVNLAINIAKKIIGEALDGGDKAYTNLAYKALKQAKGRRSVELRTSSEDYPLVLQNKDYLLSDLEGIEDINIVEDPFLARGDCIVDTGNGIVDGSARTAMERIEGSLLELVESTL